MENKTKFVSMYEITKMKFKGLNDFEKELKFEQWLKNQNEMEKIIMDEVNKKISFEIDKKIIENSGIDFEKALKETVKKMEDFLQNSKENFIELPLKVYLSYGKIWIYPSIEDEDEIMYELFLSTDVNNGKLSIQYRGENGTFLSHKQIIKAIKRENNF